MAQAAETAGEEARRPRFATRVGIDPWSEVLRELDGVVLEVVESRAERIKRFRVLYPEAYMLLEAGTMLKPPATADELGEAERRLGLSLARPHREFFLTSNGLTLPAYCLFQPLQELRSYPEADPLGAELLEWYFEEVDSPSDSEYFSYDDPGTNDEIRAEYARSAVALNGAVPESHVASKEFGWILLVREVRFDDGEYEIWEHGSWHNRRYRTFGAYFESARQAIVESLDLLSI